MQAKIKSIKDELKISKNPRMLWKKLNSLLHRQKRQHNNDDAVPLLAKKLTFYDKAELIIAFDFQLTHSKFLLISTKLYLSCVKESLHLTLFPQNV